MIGIIVLNYKNWKVTHDCLKSIFETTNNLEFRVYLVDNASPNDPHQEIIDFIRDNNRIIFIKNKVNTGYSAGNNIGIKSALNDGCDSILITNSDIIFLNDSIKEMNDYLLKNLENNVGIVGPKLLNIDGEPQVPSMCIRTGMKEKYLVRTYLRKIFPRYAKKYYCFNDQLDNPIPVHAVSGSCFMISRNCALQVTPLDENTFLYEEELILGIIMEEKGYRTVYNPKSVVIHAHGQSTNMIKPFSFICSVESEIYYCRKYLKINRLKIFPLYIIRTLSLTTRAIKYKEFRSIIFSYFRATINMLVKPLN